MNSKNKRTQLRQQMREHQKNLNHLLSFASEKKQLPLNHPARIKLLEQDPIKVIKQFKDTLMNITQQIIDAKSQLILLKRGKHAAND